MNAEFCMNCGSRYEYSLKKPNFCSACGTSFNEGDSVVEKSNEDSENTTKPQTSFASISKLEYDIGGKAPKLTFGDLISQASTDPSAAYVKMDPRPLQGGGEEKDIQKQLLNECGSVRKPNEVSD